MKHFFSLFLLVFSLALMAEDTITLVTKQVLVVDIKTISSNEITYKDPTMLDGPDFIIKKGEVASITFRNGVKQEYNHTEDLQDATIKNNNDESATIHSDLDIPNGYVYLSEDEKIKMTYDFDKKHIYLQVDKPLMCNTKDFRNVAIVYFHFGTKRLYLTADMVNKIEGVAILNGWNSFCNNIDFHRYFKKHMPKTFEIIIPYEMKQESYQMKLSNI